MVDPSRPCVGAPCMMRAVRVRAMISAALLLGWPALARGDDKADCVDAHAAAQKLERAGHFRAAREQLAVCARESCPAPVRVECDRFVAAIDAVQPTVVFDIKDEHGARVTDAAATVDRTPFPVESDEPVAFDPGPHVVTFTRPPR